MSASKAVACLGWARTFLLGCDLGLRVYWVGNTHCQCGTHTRGCVLPGPSFELAKQCLPLRVAARCQNCHLAAQGWFPTTDRQGEWVIIPRLVEVYYYQ
jgi:hypothetical protein